MKVAIVHYWLVGMRGGEKVLESLCRLFPDADIYTHVYEPEAVSQIIRRHAVRTTFISRLPLAGKLYRHYLPLMPMALEQLDLRAYDLVISSESGPAKGVLTRADCPHICYCHSPMRYLWDFYQDYLEQSGRIRRAAFSLFSQRLRLWDYASAARVDHFIANSANVAARIRKYYRRRAEVIHPPVNTQAFAPAGGLFKKPGPDAPYLLFGQLVSYKRADLAVNAFNDSGRPLLVVGEGECKKELQASARSNISFLPRQEEARVAELLSGARALIFPGEEDFGIVPVEAMAAGRPVLAFGRGGALETVREGLSGLFFHEQTPQSLNQALERFENMESEFDPAAIAAHAGGFARPLFESRMREAVERFLDAYDKDCQNFDMLY